MSRSFRQIIAFSAAAGLCLAVAAASQAQTDPAAPGDQGVAVLPVTVRPAPEGQAKVVASTDAAPLATPDFTDKDAAPPLAAVKIAPNAAAGRQVLENTPVGGFLKANPDLAGGAQSTDIGVTVVF